MDVRGRDPVTECYRVVVNVDGREVMGLVPERHAADFRQPAARPSHQDAYVWLAANRQKIETAIANLARGTGRVKPPFDEITLIEER